MKKSGVLLLSTAVAMAAAIGCRNFRVGKEAGDFSLPTVDGEMFHLSSSLGKRVVVLGVGNPFQ